MYPLPDDARHFPRRRPTGRIGAALTAALAAIVLGVPMLAQAGPGLAPSASPSGCRPVANQAQCSIAVSFNAVEGAGYYTATLTTPAGAVIPYGQIAGAGAGRISSSLSFAYAGDGAYTVTIQAWGVTDSGEPTEAASEATVAEIADADETDGEAK